MRVKTSYTPDYENERDVKQILQSLKTGKTEIAEVPTPSSTDGHVLIKTNKTLLSLGTERMLIEFGKAGYLGKMRQQPEKVGLVIDKIKTDGLQPTLDAVFSKLDQPLALGYSNVGTISAIGSGLHGFEIGDRVVSNGKHAEFVNVPKHLVAKIPSNVTDEEASFTVVGAIALQGIRLANPTLGESIAVIGLGLIGLLTVQLLIANGCRVIGLDFDPAKLALAQEFGAQTINLSEVEDPVAVATRFARGHGVDAVIITASSKSNDPVRQAAQMSRKRGRIILVGVVGLELSRNDFFEKELSFQVSCSYGPGRHDPSYEEGGKDYPVGFVRWTEQRNFEAFLDMLANKKLNLDPLISHRFDIDQANEAYATLLGNESPLGIVLNFPHSDKVNKAEPHQTNNKSETKSNDISQELSVSFIGAGQYALSKLIPAFQSSKVHLDTVVSRNGVSGLHAMQKFGFVKNVTDLNEVWSNDKTNCVVIATQHASHGQLVVSALRAGKHVFVEKPLCLTLDELAEIKEAYESAQKSETGINPILMVGFNRRFAPQIKIMKALLDQETAPKAFTMTINAGEVNPNHWTQRPDIGGGRIIGEACHFIDLLLFLANSSITAWQRLSMKNSTNDTVSIQLAFKDGSIGTIHYFANGNKKIVKERLEVFVDNKILQLNNFRKLSGHGWKDFNKMNLWRQDKGQSACANAFVEAAYKGTVAPIPFDELVSTSKICIELSE